MINLAWARLDFHTNEEVKNMILQSPFKGSDSRYQLGHHDSHLVMGSDESCVNVDLLETLAKQCSTDYEGVYVSDASNTFEYVYVEREGVARHIKHDGNAWVLAYGKPYPFDAMLVQSLGEDKSKKILQDQTGPCPEHGFENWAKTALAKRLPTGFVESMEFTTLKAPLSFRTKRQGLISSFFARLRAD